MGSEDDVDLRFNSDDRAALKSISKLEAGFVSLTGEMRKTHNLSMQQSNALVQSGDKQLRVLQLLNAQLKGINHQAVAVNSNMRRMGTANLGGVFGVPLRQLGGIAAGAFSAQAIISKMIASGREFSEQGLQASKDWDQVFREFQGQSGLRFGGADRAERRIFNTAQFAGLDIKEVGRLATQLVSSGFAPDVASGAGLREVLKGIVGANLAGKQINPEEVGKSVAAYMFSQGLDRNDPQQINRLMANIQTLYKTTELQFADFTQFAKESVVARGKMSQEEQLVILAALKGMTGSGEEASTHFRNIVLRSATAAGTTEKLKGLKMVGLKPEEVDLVGENIVTVLKRYKEAFDKVDPTTKTIALKKIFEERAVPSAEFLFEQIPWIEEKLASLGGALEQFEKDVKFASQGINAAVRRQENERQQFMAKSGTDKTELRLTEARQYMLEKGYSAFRADLNIGMARLFTYMGVNPASAVAMATSSNTLSDGKAAQVIEARVNNKIQGTGQSNEAIEKNLTKPRPVHVPPPPPPPPPPPASFFDRRMSGTIDPGDLLIKELGGPLPPEQLGGTNRYDANWLARFQHERNVENQGLLRKSKFNPLYNRAERFPEEQSILISLKKIGQEMGVRRDLFGGLSPEEQEEFRKRLAGLQGRIDKQPQSIGTFNLQQLATGLGIHLGEPGRDQSGGEESPLLNLFGRGAPAGAKQSVSDLFTNLQRIGHEADARIEAFGSLTPGESGALTAQISALQQKLDQLDKTVSTFDLPKIVEQLVTAINRNTSATEKNSGAAAGNQKQGVPQARHTPTTQTQSREYQ